MIHNIFQNVHIIPKCVLMYYSSVKQIPNILTFHDIKSLGRPGCSSSIIERSLCSLEIEFSLCHDSVKPKKLTGDDCSLTKPLQFRSQITSLLGMTLRCWHVKYLSLHSLQRHNSVVFQVLLVTSQFQWKILEGRKNSKCYGYACV